MPVAIPIMIGLTAAGTATSIYGQVKAGKAAKKIGEFNAQVAEAQAEDAILRGKEDESKFRQGVRGLIGSQRAGFAGQNVDIGQGSSVDVQADAAYLGELDALTIRTNAAREAWGYKVQAQNARMGGNAQASANYWGAATSALTGGATLFQIKYGSGRRSYA